MQRAERYSCCFASNLARWLIVSAAIACFAGPMAGAEPDKEVAPIFAAAQNAVARGQVEKTALVGFTLTKNTFEELPGDGAVLVGFDLGLGKFVNIENIYALRPVYRTADGEVSYGEHGLFSSQPGLGKNSQKSKVVRTVSLRAPAAYAVGSVTLRAGLNINGLCLTYLCINGQTLDTDQAYASDWVGDRTGGREATIGGDGAPIVGVFGNKDDVRVSALGLICIGDGAAAVKPRTPAPGSRQSKNSEPGRPGGAEPRPRAAGAPPWQQLELPDRQQGPAQTPDWQPTRRARETYRDAEHHFSFDIPPGWGKMSRTELDKIDELLRQRGLSNRVHYETGFRPAGTALGEYPYILLQVQPIKTAGLSYAEIQRTLNLGLDGPMKTVEGAFSDFVRGTPSGTAMLDRGRDRIIVRLQMDVAYFGKIDGLSVCHLGSDAVVSVHAYAKETTFANYLSVFNDLDTTFEFDNGYTFVPAKDRDVVATLLPVLAFAGVAVPLGAVFLAFAAWKRRR